MVEAYLAAVFALVLLTVAAFELLMPSLTRRDLLFGVTVAAGARDSDAGRALIRNYRLGVVALAVLASAGLAALVAFAPTGWWTSGALAPVGIVVALLPGLPYLPAHLAARRLASTAVGAPDGAPLSGTPAAQVAELRPRHYSEYVPWVWEALPLGILAATVAYLAAGYAAAPAIIPIHFGADGQPDAYAAKTIYSYFAVAWTQLGMEVLLTGLAVLIAHGKALPDRADAIFRRRGLRYLYAIKVLMLVLLGGTGAWIAHAEAAGHAQAGGVLYASLGFTVAVLALGLIVSVRTGQGGARLAGASPSDRTDDRYWRLGAIYVNRDDPALIVERRFGFGWTMNFGNPLSWVLLVAILAVPLLIALASTLSATGAR